ncbi:hypothetical protein EVAR_39749_1 [Eumeta japonica]|uniref:Uncharacterized protein n=1 Tax=Eumeta variegata TaxID=151549 RepID=A0A4C1X4G9_EUMVA|nr:hypothetical protein EVAR_39749_1 [Eumeta japonica]
MASAVLDAARWRPVRRKACLGHGLMMELLNFQLRYQTLKSNHGQSVFNENINKSKHGYAALFHYGVLASTFRFHHQNLETKHG